MFQWRAITSLQGRKRQSCGLGSVPGPRCFTAGEEALRLLSPWPSRTAKHFSPQSYSCAYHRKLFVMESFASPQKQVFHLKYVHHD